MLNTDQDACVMRFFGWKLLKGCYTYLSVRPAIATLMMMTAWLHCEYKWKIAEGI